MNETKILSSLWFGHIGIVKVFNGFETKWYIGNGEGYSIEADERYIADYGTKFYPSQFQNSEFFKNVDTSNVDTSKTENN